jgi:hypothetical protein
METTTHTPGPWIADPCSHADGSTTIRVADGSECGDIYCQPIAQVWNSRDDLLIASAPEILEALRLCCSTYGRTCGQEWDGVPLAEWEVKARAAIARATGDAEPHYWDGPISPEDQAPPAGWYVRESDGSYRDERYDTSEEAWLALAKATGNAE